MPRVLISAGDVSGDLHAEGVIRELRRRGVRLELTGLGGPRMEAAGFSPLVRSAGLSVVGLTEVVEKFGALRRALALLKNSMDTARPDLLMLVDFPDFNLMLAAAAKKRGIPVLYYIGPQVWAWRRGRIKTIRRLVDRMAVIFPFEAELYRNAGIQAEYVGHPLAERADPLDMDGMYRAAGVERGARIVALLPGSRSSEVSRMFPVLGGAAEILGRDHPDLRFIMPLATGERLPGMARIPRLSAITGMVPEVLRAATAAVITSGTATLEGAIAGTPMVVVYKLSPLSYLLGRLLISVPAIGLVNLVAEKPIVPELIQSQASPERVAAKVEALLEDADIRRKMKGDLAAVSAALSDPSHGAGASHRIADIVLSMIQS